MFLRKRVKALENQIEKLTEEFTKLKDLQNSTVVYLNNERLLTAKKRNKPLITFPEKDD